VPYGPAEDAYDLDAVVSAAMQHEPSLSHSSAVALATQAYGLLVQIGEPDAPALARGLLGLEVGIGVSEINAVARATVDFFEGA
jgi:hypothetical protein